MKYNWKTLSSIKDDSHLLKKCKHTRDDEKARFESSNLEHITDYKNYGHSAYSVYLNPNTGKFEGWYVDLWAVDPCQHIYELMCEEDDIELALGALAHEMALQDGFELFIVRRQDNDLEVKRFNEYRQAKDFIKENDSKYYIRPYEFSEEAC